MYKKFNTETDKDLILLNYYIEQNVKKTTIELTIKDVENILNVNRSKAYRCIKKLEELGIIESIEKSKSKSKKTEYKYLLKKNTTDKNYRSKSKGTKKEIPEHLSEYADIYVKYLGKTENLKIMDILKIKDIEKIEVKLFESILEDSKLNAIKNPHNYARISITKTIEDGVFTFEERKKRQRVLFNINKNAAKNYTDDSENEDWEALTKQAMSYT